MSSCESLTCESYVCKLRELNESLERLRGDIAAERNARAADRQAHQEALAAERRRADERLAAERERHDAQLAHMVTELEAIQATVNGDLAKLLC